MRLLIALLLTLLSVMPLAAQDEAATTPPAQVIGSGDLFDAAWSPDGTQIAVSTATGVAILNQQLETVAALTGSGDFNTVRGRLAWSPNGARLALEGGNMPQDRSFAAVWDVASGELEWAFLFTTPIVSQRPVWDSTSDRFALPLAPGASGVSDSVFIWESGGTEATVAIDQPVEVGATWSWSGDGSALQAVGALDRVLIDAETGAILDRIPFENSNRVVSPDGTASAEVVDGETTVTTAGWSLTVEAEGEVSRFRGYRTAKWSPDSRFLATWGVQVDPEIVITDIATASIVFSRSFDTSTILFQVEFNPVATHQLLLTTARDEILIYDVLTGALLAQRRFTGGAASLSYNPAGGELAAVTSDGQIAYLWDTESGTVNRTVGIFDRPLDDPNYFTSVANSPDGRFIAVGTQRGGPFIDTNESRPIDLYIFDAATGDLLRTAPALAYDADYIHRLDWSADSRLVAYATWSSAARISHIGVYDTAAGAIAFQTVTELSITDIALHPGGDILALTGADALGGGFPVRLLDASTGALLADVAAYPGGWATLDWNSAGNQLAVAAFNGRDRSARLELFDANSLTQPTVLSSIAITGMTYNSILRWSPAGDAVALASRGDGMAASVQVWNIAADPTGTRPASTFSVTLTEDANVLASLAWSLDGAQIAASFGLARTYIWER
jgi:WD40 repeat protein